MQIQSLVLCHGDRFAVVVALDYLAAEGPEFFNLMLLLRSFGKACEAQFLCEEDYVLDYGDVLRALVFRNDFVNEALVDFQGVQGHACEE